MTVYPAAAIRLITTRVNPIEGAYRTSFNKIFIIVDLFGISTWILPFPIAGMNTDPLLQYFLGRLGYSQQNDGEMGTCGVRHQNHKAQFQYVSSPLI
jgi:hypothetical protein